jgi:hypothetical protein
MVAKKNPKLAVSWLLLSKVRKGAERRLRNLLGLSSLAWLLDEQFRNRKLSNHPFLELRSFPHHETRICSRHFRTEAVLLDAYIEFERLELTALLLCIDRRGTLLPWGVGKPSRVGARCGGSPP